MLRLRDLIRLSKYGLFLLVIGLELVKSPVKSPILAFRSPQIMILPSLANDSALFMIELVIDLFIGSCSCEAVLK